MMTNWDEVVLDAAELRDAASTLRNSGANFADLASRLPTEVPDAPWWVSEQVGDELWRIRGECAELTDELASAARELELRAAEVESSDRTYDLVDGRLRSCCRLADGTIVTLANETTVMNAGAIGSLAPVTIGASAVGEAAWGTGGGFTSIGGGVDLGGGTGGGFTSIGGGGIDISAGDPRLSGLDALDGILDGPRIPVYNTGADVNATLVNGMFTRAQIGYNALGYSRAGAVDSASLAGPAYTTGRDSSGYGTVELRNSWDPG